MAITFGGRVLVRPQAATKVLDAGLANLNALAQQTVAVLGTSEGGDPKTALIFTDPATARDVLRSGNLADGVELVFDPSPSTPGASRVIAVRVNPATQSLLVLKDALAATVITLTSKDFGTRVNRLRVKIEAGTEAGTKKITTNFDAETFVKDNIGKKSFTLKYVGAGTTATVEVTATTLITTVDASPDVSLVLADFPTVQALVNFLESQADYEATVTTTSPETDEPVDLDFVTAGQDIKTAEFQLTTNLQAIVDYFNSLSGVHTAVRAASVGTVPVNIAFTFFTGGTTPIPTTSDWQDALDVLKIEDVAVIVTLTADAAIHAMGNAHVQSLSTSGKKERLQISGGALGESVSAIKARAVSLNSFRTALAAPGLRQFDRNGQLVSRPPYFLAAQIAGMLGGVDVAEPLTHKFVRAQGVDTEFTFDQIDDLVSGGVLVVEEVRGQGRRIVKSVTTWLQDTNFSKIEISTRRALDFTARSVRDAIERDLVGQKGSPSLIARTLTLTESILRDLVRQEVLVGDVDDPPFKNIAISLQGDVIFVQFEAHPVIPANFFLITISATPFSGAAQATSP